MAYLGIDDIKSYIDVKGSGDDDLLTTLIAAAQAAIDTHCHRTFEASIDTTRTFDAIRNVYDSCLVLDEDLAAITTVTNGNSVVVAANEYTTEPRNSTPYHELKLLASSNKTWTYTTDPEDAISITGRWAYSTMPPADVVQACKRLTAYMYRQKDNSSDIDRPLMTSEGIAILPSQFPKDVKMMLQSYVRVTPNV